MTDDSTGPPNRLLTSVYEKQPQNLDALWNKARFNDHLAAHEVQPLIAELREAREDMDGYWTEILELRDQLAEARQERRRLREVAKKAISYCNYHINHWYDGVEPKPEGAKRLIAAAEAALEKATYFKGAGQDDG